MEDLKGLLMKFFSTTNKYFTYAELRKNFKIKGEEQTNIFDAILKEMVENGSLFFDDKKGYKAFTNDVGFAFGKLEINMAGNGFVNTKNGYKLFIRMEDLKGALNGDNVIVACTGKGKYNDYTGEVKKITKRNNGKIIFQVIGNGSSASIVPYNKYQIINVNLNKSDYKKFVDGDLIELIVDKEMENGVFSARLENIIGHKDDPDIDVRILATKYEFPIDFSKEAMNEAMNLPDKVSEEEAKQVVDLRGKNFVTIDCDTTKDRDDAVFLELLPNGNYHLMVSIARVNYYVKRGSKLFEEAVERKTSHYTNNTCIPMFPHKLSNGICSLNEKVDRLTKTCDMEIDKKGNVVNYKIYNSVINSKKAMKYSEVNKVLDNKEVAGYETFIENIKLMHQLSKILENKKQDRSYMDFGLNDIDTIQDELKNPIEFIASGIGDAEKIIENFMLITNTTIAEEYSWLPFIFRIHEYPNEATVKEVLSLLKTSGFKIPNSSTVNEKVLKKILDKLGNTDEGRIAKELILRAMKKARYDIQNIGHFALQLEKYCHFTSPIRRIVDFMIHTVIDEIDVMDYNTDKIENLEKELKEIAIGASDFERKDKEMEEEGRMMLMAQYMEEHIGEEFEAYVTQIYTRGMLAKTKNFIPGKIKLEDISDDNYYYDNEKKAIIGRKTKKKYQIGNKVYVVVKGANKENLSINFKIDKQKSLSLA